MKHIRQITDGVYTVVKTDLSDLTQHPCFKFAPDDFEIIDGEIPAEAQYLIYSTPVPEVVSRRQLKLQLVLSGFDLSNIDAAIAQLPEPHKSIALVSWNDAITFERNDKLLIQLGNVIGFTDSDLDNIFINAATL